MTPEQELVPQPVPSQNERQPMPAPKAGMRSFPGMPGKNLLGLAAAGLLAAGLASFLLFRGNTKQPPPVPASAQAAAVENQPASPVPAAPRSAAAEESPAPVQPASALNPMLLGGEPPSQPSWPAGAAVPAEAQPEEAAQMARMTAQVNLELIGVLKNAGIKAQPAAAVGAACASCQNGVPGTQGQANTIPTGTYFIDNPTFAQYGIKQHFSGMCDGKYMYEFKNPSTKTRQVSIVTQQGETWNLNLGPGKSASVKSSTEFVGGSYSVTWR